MVSELLTRAAKHLFTQYIQGVETMYLSNAISHFLNCFLSSCSSLPSPVSSDEVSTYFTACLKELCCMLVYHM